MADEELTESEKQEIKDLLGYGSNLPDTKHNVHTFLNNVATAEDTTKLGNLEANELGNLNNPVRAFKHLGIFAERIMHKKDLAGFFYGNSEIGTSTSLSKEGFLVKQATLQKRVLADETKKRKPNKGWFKSKDKGEDNDEQG